MLLLQIQLANSKIRSVNHCSWSMDLISSSITLRSKWTSFIRKLGHISLTCKPGVYLSVTVRVSPLRSKGNIRCEFQGKVHSFSKKDRCWPGNFTVNVKCWKECLSVKYWGSFILCHCHSVRGLLHYKYCPPDTSLHLSYNSPHTTLVILFLGDDLQFQDYDTLPFIYHYKGSWPDSGSVAAGLMTVLSNWRHNSINFRVVLLNLLQLLHICQYSPYPKWILLNMNLHLLGTLPPLFSRPTHLTVQGQPWYSVASLLK